MSCSFSLLRIVAIAAACAGVSTSARAEPDELLLGKEQGFPTGAPAAFYDERFKIGNFSGATKMFPTHTVAHGDAITPLEKDPAPPAISYSYGGARGGVDDYLEHQRATGLLILKGDRILLERYRYGRTEHDRFLSFSMAKSVNSLLLGIALQRGLIPSLDDLAEKYVPEELKGSAYGETSIQNLLHGSSGAVFSEHYDGNDDVHRLMLAARGVGGQSPLQFLASFHERSFQPGEKFAYTSAESTVLGYVLHRAAHATIAELATDWLWKPLGAETDAAWIINADGQEGVEGRFNATLRDYGRIGLLLANDGRIGDKQIVPSAYLLNATDAALQPPVFRPLVATPYYGYGNQFWIQPMRVRTFACLGIYGQAIFVQPESKIVMVQTAVWREPTDVGGSYERDALWRGVLQSLGGSLDPINPAKQ